MKPTVERLTEQFTQLIGPETIEKAKAARAAAEAAAAKAAAEAAAAKAAAAAAAAPRPPTLVPSAAPPPPPRPSSLVPPAAKPPAPPAPLAPLPITATDHAAKGYHFDAIVTPDQIVDAAQILDREGFGLDTITGVDWIADNQMEVVYDYFHPTDPTRVVVRTRVPRATPVLPTISPVFSGANWHEREAHDFFGITFAGHPNLKPLLLPEDADFHPLRKDYQP